MKLLKITAVIATLLITSACSNLSGLTQDPKLTARCETVRKNLAALAELPADLEEWRYATPDYMASNAGKIERAKFKQIVDLKYPWVATFAEPGLENTFYDGIQLAIWNVASEGTDVAYKLTSEDIELAQKEKDSFYKLIDLHSLIGSDDSDEEYALCSKLDHQEGVERPRDFNTTAVLWDKAITTMFAISEKYSAVRSCQLTGKWSYIKCAKKQYVGTTDYESSPITPWDWQYTSEDDEFWAKYNYCHAQSQLYSYTRDKCVDHF